MVWRGLFNYRSKMWLVSNSMEVVPVCATISMQHFPRLKAWLLNKVCCAYDVIEIITVLSNNYVLSSMYHIRNSLFSVFLF